MRTFSLIMDRLFRFFLAPDRNTVPVWLADPVAAVGRGILDPCCHAVHLRFFRENPGESAWHWVVFGPFMLIGVVLAYRDWLDRSDAENFSVALVATATALQGSPGKPNCANWSWRTVF